MDEEALKVFKAIGMFIMLSGYRGVSKADVAEAANAVELILEDVGLAVESEAP